MLTSCGFVAISEQCLVSYSGYLCTKTIKEERVRSELEV